MEENVSLISLLHNAYRLADAADATLRRRIQEREGFPTFRHADELHLAETQNHKALLAQCLARYGETPERPSTDQASATSFPAGMLWHGANESLVEALQQDYLTEQAQIITCHALIEAAALIGDSQTLMACETILRDENRRAHQISNNLPIALAVQFSEMTYRGGKSSTLSR